MTHEHWFREPDPHPWLRGTPQPGMPQRPPILWPERPSDWRPEEWGPFPAPVIGWVAAAERTERSRSSQRTAIRSFNTAAMRGGWI